MPNWCSNSVTISGDSEKIKELGAIITKGLENDMCFQAIRPKPEDVEDWYGWNVANWGTKWDINPNNFSIEDDIIYLDFDSAWSPPIALYDYLTEQGFDVEAKYYEPGMAFVGSYEDGMDYCSDLDFSSENWRDDISSELIDWAGLEEEYEYVMDMYND